MAGLYVHVRTALARAHAVRTNWQHGLPILNGLGALRDDVRLGCQECQKKCSALHRAPLPTVTVPPRCRDTNGIDRGPQGAPTATSDGSDERSGASRRNPGTGKGLKRSRTPIFSPPMAMRCLRPARTTASATPRGARRERTTVHTPRAESERGVQHVHDDDVDDRRVSIYRIHDDTNLMTRTRHRHTNTQACTSRLSLPTACFPA